MLGTPLTGADDVSGVGWDEGVAAFDSRPEAFKGSDEELLAIFSAVLYLAEFGSPGTKNQVLRNQRSLHST